MKKTKNILVIAMSCLLLGGVAFGETNNKYVLTTEIQNQLTSGTITTAGSSSADSNISLKSGESASYTLTYDDGHCGKDHAVTDKYSIFNSSNQEIGYIKQTVYMSCNGDQSYQGHYETDKHVNSDFDGKCAISTSSNTDSGLGTNDHSKTKNYYVYPKPGYSDSACEATSIVQE